MFTTSSAKIPEKLRDVIVCQRATRLQFNDKSIIHEEIRIEVSKDCVVFVEDLEGMLLMEGDRESA